MLKRLSVVLLAALAVACGDDRPVLKVGVNGTSFQREVIPSTATSPTAVVPYDVWNRGNATAFIPACGGRPSAVVERYVDRQWDSYASGFCVDFGADLPIELRVGESRRYEVVIGEAGHYRIRMPYSAAASGGNSFNSVSTDFDVH